MLKVLLLLYCTGWLRLMLWHLQQAYRLYRQAINPVPFLRARLGAIFGWPYYLYQSPRQFYQYYLLGRPWRGRP